MSDTDTDATAAAPPAEDTSDKKGKWGNLKKKTVADNAVQAKGGHFDSADWAMQAKKAQGAGGNAKKPLPPHLRKG